MMTQFTYNHLTLHESNHKSAGIDISGLLPRLKHVREIRIRTNDQSRPALIRDNGCHRLPPPLLPGRSAGGEPLAARRPNRNDGLMER